MKKIGNVRQCIKTVLDMGKKEETRSILRNLYLLLGTGSLSIIGNNYEICDVQLIVKYLPWRNPSRSAKIVESEFL